MASELPLDYLLDSVKDSTSSGYSDFLLQLHGHLETLKSGARDAFQSGNLEKACSLYCDVLGADPIDSLKLINNNPEKVLPGSQLESVFTDRYDDFNYQKNLIHSLAGNLGINLDEKMFNPLSAYKDFWKLFRRSCKENEWSGTLTYGFALVSGIIPPYADFEDNNQDNKIDRIFIRPAGFSISPLAPLLALEPKIAMGYGAMLGAYHLLMHGFYNGTKRGRFRVMGHEYTHFHQILLVQRMHNDGLCSDVNACIDQAYNEFEQFSLGKHAIGKDLKEMNPEVVDFVLGYELGSR